MCRFTLYQGKPIFLKSIISEPEHSIIHQSYGSKERKEPLNGDGFGVGWFPEASSKPGPAIFKETAPAWNDPNLIDLSHVIKSNCILAHVRATTFESDIAVINCHPFKIQNYLFCHNGYIKKFIKIKKKLIAQIDDLIFEEIKGSTDSEYMFALILTFLKQYDDRHNVENMAKAFKQAIYCITDLVKQYLPEEYCTLNMAMTDGSNSVVSRYSSNIEKNIDSLYICQGADLKNDDEKYLRQKNDNIYEKSLIVSSEPLSVGGIGDR